MNEARFSKDVYARLKRSIFDFRMPPGQRYSEQELAAKFEVSRTPLRLALHVLAHEGYLQNLGGHSAWRVRPLDLAFYEDLYDFRVEIETTALRLARIRDHAQELASLIAVWSVPLTDRLTDGNIVGEIDETFHQTLVGFGGNHAMLRAFKELTERIRIISPSRLHQSRADLLGLRRTFADPACARETKIPSRPSASSGSTSRRPASRSPHHPS